MFINLQFFHQILNKLGHVFWVGWWRRWVLIGTPRPRNTGPLNLCLLFKFIGGYSAAQPPYQKPQYYSVSPLLLDLDPSCQSPRSASLSFPTLVLYIRCTPTFLFLHCISCMREFLLFSSCAACIA